MNARPARLLCLPRSGLWPLACGLWVLAATGCLVTLPQAEIDPTRYYVLSTSAAPVAAPVADGAPAIHLRQVEVASYLTARPMIVRRGDNEIQFREFARWGEPLDLGIGRVLREELLARGAASVVLASGLRSAQVAYAHELTVRVLACEGRADGGINFRAVWELTATGAKPAAAARGDFRAVDSKWDGKSESALAARLSEAVAGLAAEIAGGLAKAK